MQAYDYSMILFLGENIFLTIRIQPRIMAGINWKESHIPNIKIKTQMLTRSNPKPANTSPAPPLAGMAAKPAINMLMPVTTPANPNASTPIPNANIPTIIPNAPPKPPIKRPPKIGTTKIQISIANKILLV